MPLRRLVAPLLMLLVWGCGPETGTTTVTAAEVTPDDDYIPAYYDGFVVYYDDGGNPYYYDGGLVVWIRPSSPHYVGLKRHWLLYGPRYREWERHRGVQYRQYRTAPGYHSYRGHR